MHSLQTCGGRLCEGLLDNAIEVTSRNVLLERETSAVRISREREQMYMI